MILLHIYFYLKAHEPTIDWPCFECSMQFMSSAELQDHLNIHDEVINDFNLFKITSFKN